MERVASNKMNTVDTKRQRIEELKKEIDRLEQEMLVETSGITTDYAGRYAYLKDDDAYMAIESYVLDVAGDGQLMITLQGTLIKKHFWGCSVKHTITGTVESISDTIQEIPRDEFWKVHRRLCGSLSEDR